MIKWLLLPAAYLAAGAANAQALPTVFGVQLGTPVTLPECQHIEGAPPGPDGMPLYKTKQPATCVTRPRQLTRSPFREADIFFPHDKTPELSVVDLIGTYLSKSSDNVIAIEAATPGYARADWIIAQLTAKFGKPIQVLESRRIIDDVPVPAKHAVWRGKGFTVDYQSFAPSDASSGELLVSTDEYDRLAIDDLEAKDAKKTPL